MEVANICLISRHYVSRLDRPMYNFFGRLGSIGEICQSVSCKDQKYSAVIDEIRQIYELFKEPASEYDQIYEKISICIAEYRKMVRQNT